MSRLSWGTPEYLSPERSASKLHSEVLSDIWSLGVTFYEILIGRTPFEADAEEEFLSKEGLEEYHRRTVKGTWLGEWKMTRGVEAIIRGMVRPEVGKRWRSCEEVKRRGARWFDGLEEEEEEEEEEEDEEAKQVERSRQVLGEITNTTEGNRSPVMRKRVLVDGTDSSTIKRRLNPATSPVVNSKLLTTVVEKNQRTKPIEKGSMVSNDSIKIVKSASARKDDRVKTLRDESIRRGQCSLSSRGIRCLTFLKPAEPSAPSLKPLTSTPPRKQPPASSRAFGNDKTNASNASSIKRHTTPSSPTSSPSNRTKPLPSSSLSSPKPKIRTSPSKVPNALASASSRTLVRAKSQTQSRPKSEKEDGGRPKSLVVEEAKKWQGSLKGNVGRKVERFESLGKSGVNSRRMVTSEEEEEEMVEVIEDNRSSESFGRCLLVEIDIVSSRRHFPICEISDQSVHPFHQISLRLEFSTFSNHRRKVTRT
jgi:hypothetical protein